MNFTPFACDTTVFLSELMLAKICTNLINKPVKFNMTDCVKINI